MGIFWTLREYFIKRRAKAVLKSMLSSEDENIRMLGSSVHDSFESSLSADEKKWVNQIESVRGQTNDSKEIIVMQDFGARDPQSQLSKEEMYEGISKEICVGDMSRISSKASEWALILFKLIRYFKPKVCIELGTCCGISTAYQAAALKLNGKGVITSIEGAEPLSKVAQENFSKLNLNNITAITGRFQDVLETELSRLEAVDFAFIDGHHDGQATINYYQKICNFLSPMSIVVFDDIYWSKGMNEAWLEIIKRDEVFVSCDIGMIGICIINKQKDSAISNKSFDLKRSIMEDFD